jgi:hypothetical protein
VRFYVGYCELRLYCFKPGEGWRAASGTPRFIRLKPTEDGRIAEVYEIENKEFVRVV